MVNIIFSVILQGLFFYSFPIFTWYIDSFTIHAQVSPAYVRGTYGSCTQIATCLGLMGALFIGLPAKETEGW